MGAHFTQMLSGCWGLELFKLKIIGVGLPLCVKTGIYKYAMSETDPIK